MDIELAISIALKAHHGQVDKGGNAYILHPLAVMNRVETIEEKIVAILHDVVEDTEISIHELKNKYGFSDVVIDAIDRLTKRQDETYEAFIRRTLGNPISRRVKIADIQENMDITRICNPTEQDYERLEKYKSAIEILMNKTET